MQHEVTLRPVAVKKTAVRQNICIYNVHSKHCVPIYRQRADLISVYSHDQWKSIMVIINMVTHKVIFVLRLNKTSSHSLSGIGIASHRTAVIAASHGVNLRNTTTGLGCRPICNPRCRAVHDVNRLERHSPRNIHS